MNIYELVNKYLIAGYSEDDAIPKVAQDIVLLIMTLSIHDYRKCKCGACSIDSGKEYTRIGGNFKFINIVNENKRIKNV